MAVPAGEREEGKFTLPMKAEQLVAYTIQITANEKVFLPEYRERMTDDIVETAKNVYLGIREANDTTVRVGTIFHRKDFIDRNTLQRKALKDAKRLLYLIDIAHRLFHLSSKRVAYWSDMVQNVRNRIQGWTDDDFFRFAP